MADQDCVEYVIVNNIPSIYHSSDLRNFFSHFVETEGFQCFHFRHRPEIQTQRSSSDNDKQTQAKHRTCCCVIRVKKDRVKQLIKSYHRKHWIDKKGETLPSRCFLSCVELVESSDAHNANEGKYGEHNSSLLKSLSKSDVSKLLEMHPPPVMPNGNVGTPTKVFLELIRSCRLPPMIIKKLDLEFPRSRCSRLYSSVPYKYEGKVVKFVSEIDEEIVRTGKGDIISENDVSSLQSKQVDAADDTLENEEQEDEESEDDNDTCEEWERHEALHNDVTSQERLKERLFEEKIELKWEKGGSGLVFYTDAQYWDAQEGDFDEKTADDWDVDTSIYYHPNAGDKDSQDLLQMAIEKRLREGTDDEDYSRRKIGRFESHTKGIGRKVLEKHGWKEGEGLGSTVRGPAEPIDEMGQNPRDKRGLGFRGEKLQRHGFSQSRKRQHSLHRITTVYDNPKTTDPKESLLRSSLLTRLTFRKEFLKSTEKILGNGNT